MTESGGEEEERCSVGREVRKVTFTVTDGCSHREIVS